jgi:flavin-dependent dehydrogenase
MSSGFSNLGRTQVTVIGGGPAGASAALSALHHGASVTVLEKSRFPRHKVCGEFLSPEVQAPLSRLGVWNAIQLRNPARITRMALHFARSSKRARLPEPGIGLSRYWLDATLLQQAVSLGAQPDSSTAPGSLIIRADGRTPSKAGTRTSPQRGSRVFGFKAHFTGPQDDAVELFFFRGCYVGVSSIEEGKTNVCGLGPENVLREFGFDAAALLETCPALKARLSPLTPFTPWFNVGPLVFQQNFDTSAHPDEFLAGDALSFVDPFTGSGMLSAILTGELAGQAASENWSVAQYNSAARKMLGKPFQISSIFRKVAGTSVAGALAALVPASLLFRLTRPTSSH